MCEASYASNETSERIWQNAQTMNIINASKSSVFNPIVVWSFKRFVTKTSFSGRMKMLQNFTSIKRI